MIDERLVRQVARLARLELSDDEVTRFKTQLDDILSSMDELKAVDTEGVAPTAHVLGLTDVLREDAARPFAHREDLLAVAPRREGAYFRVPKVIE